MKYIATLLLLILPFLLNAQIKGKVTYRLSIKKDSIEKPNTNPEKTAIENDVLKMLHNSLPVESYLVFNDSIAIYKVEERIDIPGYINVNWIMAGGSSIFYTDWSRNYNISQNDIMGTTKRIIKDSLPWKLTEKTKVIQGYLCNLATLDKSKGDKKLKVWYTQEIPVKQGPAGYNGLPGLVMEIDDVIQHWIVSKIDFDNKEADEIIEPTEGELVTAEEYRKSAGNIFGKE